MSNEIAFHHLPSKDAEIVSEGMKIRLNIEVNALQSNVRVDPFKKNMIFNGDGYMHHFTRSILKELITERKSHGLPPISYVHIDGHDDMAAMNDGDDFSYKSFVLGIVKDNGGGVYLLEEGLTGERKSDISFLVPILDSASWGISTKRLRDKNIYVSADLDVLDFNAGVNHLFPQTPIGFNVERLIDRLKKIGKKYNVVAADMVGFSSRNATERVVKESLDNIAKITTTFMEILSK
jgi:arginase family enzyme